MCALAVDGSGNVYAGGEFTVIGTVVANGIAKWDGSTWSALGTGMDGLVYALAVRREHSLRWGIVHQCGRRDGQLHSQVGWERVVSVG